MARVRLAILLLAVFARSCWAPRPAPVLRGSAEAFASTLGVNVHLQYSDTPYADVSRVQGALTYLDVRHLRDSAFRNGAQGLDHYISLARQGARFDLFLNANPHDQLQHVRDFVSQAPTGIELLEGPNEINNDPVAFAGLTGEEAGEAYQAALVQSVRSDSKLRGYPVLAFTDWPPSRSLADAVNVHSYPKRGASSQPTLSRDVELAAATQPVGRPVYVTETGFNTSAPTTPDGVDAQRQAALDVVAWLDAFRAGVRRVYLYELFDEHADLLSRTEPEHHYGLFDQTGSPKPAALAIRTLMGVLSSARDVTKHDPVAASVLRLTTPYGVKRLDLERADGVHVTIVWRETVSPLKGQAAHVRIDNAGAMSLAQVSLQTAASRDLSSDDHVDFDLWAMPQVFLASPLSEVRSGDRK